MSENFHECTKMTENEFAQVQKMSKMKPEALILIRFTNFSKSDFFADIFVNCHHGNFPTFLNPVSDIFGRVN